jgi:hypothetical protein
MEKKDEILNQLAKISDSIDKINVRTKSSTIILELSRMDFDNVYNEMVSKYGRRIEKPKDTFTITIGMVDFVFNTSNV